MNDFFLLLPALRRGDAVAHPRQQEGRQSANRKHPAPAKFASNQKVQNRRQKNPYVVSGVHVARASATAVLRPFFRDEGSTHGPLAADADPGEQTQSRKLPDVCDQGTEKCEYRIPNNPQHQRSHSPKFIADRSPQKRQSPPNQE